MQTEFTKIFMQENCGCYSQSELYECSFMRSENITLESIIKSEIPLKDKFWFVCKRLASKEENQFIAIGVAEIVLPIYEKRYPDDLRPREAIGAAKQFIAGHISIDKLLAKRRAATAAAAAAADDAAAAYAAAYDAAYDAAIAYAAADAATAAAADAAADAADAAAAATAYAAAAYDAAEIKQQLQDFLLNFYYQKQPA